MSTLRELYPNSRPTITIIDEQIEETAVINLADESDTDSSKTYIALP